jgi:hypothetical protein
MLKCAGLVPFAGAVPRVGRALDQAPSERADYTLRIGTGLVELAPDHIVSTTLYNGEFPGPLVRLKEGQRVVVDIYNDTDTPELVHWHGQMIPSDVDGAAEEGAPFIPARGMRQVVFVPRPAALMLPFISSSAAGKAGGCNAKKTTSWAAATRLYGVAVTDGNLAPRDCNTPASVSLTTIPASDRPARAQPPRTIRATRPPPTIPTVVSLMNDSLPEIRTSGSSELPPLADSTPFR